MFLPNYNIAYDYPAWAYGLHTSLREPSWDGYGGGAGKVLLLDFVAPVSAKLCILSNCAVITQTNPTWIFTTQEVQKDVLAEKNKKRSDSPVCIMQNYCLLSSHNSWSVYRHTLEIMQVQLQTTLIKWSKIFFAGG